MAVDFTHAPDRQYCDYLTSHNVRMNVDVVMSKPIRQAIGSIEDIFKRNTTDMLTGALRDFIWFRAGPNEYVEVIRVNLHAICAELDMRSADSVTGFQSLFVKPEERDPANGHLGVSDDPVPAAEGDPYGKAVTLARQHRYAPALKALQAGGADWRCHYLRGVLLRGIAGQPKSAEIVDLEAAEAAFLAAAERVNDPSEAARARIGAGNAAYADSRIADATAHFRAALELDPRNGEAHFQMARLAMQTKDLGAVRQHLPEAFDRHWSYGVRAASDPVLASGPTLVAQCARGVARDIGREIGKTFTQSDAGLKFLRAQQDMGHPIVALEAYKPLMSEVKRVAAALPPRLLKRAFDLRRKTQELHRGIERLALDYCALLRHAEGTIVHRDRRYRNRRDPVDIARALATRARPLLSAIAVPAADGRRMERTIVAAAAAVQQFVTQRELRRNAASVARNRTVLLDRLHRIERRFGFVAE